ncbi:MAG: response regulator, partial [Aequorivita sp.]|nr:response regulator [Aequorivita sp.]
MTKKPTILLAEDEPALGMIIKESLETRNFEVLLCTDGDMALKTYKAKKPELLVLDVMMPKKDGFTVAKEIRLLDNYIPILFLTAKSQTQDVVEGFSIGGNDYLKKPFSMEELIVRMNNLLNRTKLQQEVQEII